MASESQKFPEREWRSTRRRRSAVYGTTQILGVFARSVDQKRPYPPGVD